MEVSATNHHDVEIMSMATSNWMSGVAVIAYIREPREKPDLNEVIVVAEGDRRATINLKAAWISKARKFARDSKNVGDTEL
jgi:hypothetical protein